MNDRLRGCLIGLAVGDALGAAVEFKAPGTFPQITTYRDGGPHNLNKGEWTDDTSMALALADSLKHGWNLNDQARRYCEWLENGKYSVNGWCFDIGATTREALENFMEHGNAETSGLTAPDASGNGGIMRLAPVAIYCATRYLMSPGTYVVYNLGAESSAVTHASRMCIAAAGLMNMMLVDLIQGKSREEALRYREEWEQILHPAIIEVMKGSYKRKSPPKNLNEWWPEGKPDIIQGSGFVVRSLEAALWAFWDAQDFKEAVLRAVNLGEDSDTTGAICGQFAGAYWGESSIPQEWRDGLARKDMIETALTGLIS